MLPGVTVEARSDVLPGPRVTVTGPRRRVPAAGAAAGRLHADVHALGHADRDAPGAGPARPRHDGRRGAGRAGRRQRAVTVTADAALDRQDSAAITSGMSSEQINALPVGQEYRDLIKLIPGVQYTQDTTRGPSAGGSGQDNVYQFDGVNVTLPLFGTLSAEPASHDIAQVTVIKGGAQGGGLRPRRRLRHRLGQQVGHEPLHRAWSAASSRTTSMAAELDQRQRVALRAGPRMWTTSTSAARSWRTSCSSTRRTTGRRTRATTGRTSTASCRTTSSTRNEGFGKVTVTPTQLDCSSTSAIRDSHRLDKSDLFGASASRRPPAPATRRRCSIGTVDGSWVINAQSFATFKCTHFANETQGRPDNVAERRRRRRRSARGSTSAAWTRWGCSRCRRPIAGQRRVQRVRPAADRPLRLSTQDGVEARRRHWSASAATFDKDDFFRDGVPVRLQHHARRAAACATTCTPATSATRTPRICCAARTAGARSPCRAAARSFQGTADLLSRAFQQQGSAPHPARSTPSTGRRASSSTTRSAGSNWTFNAGRARQQRHAYGQGLNDDDSTLSGYVTATRWTSRRAATRCTRSRSAR